MVGSMAQTVKQLHLDVENRDGKHDTTKASINSANLIQSNKSWSRAEDHRRIFWNIFIIDRLCSIMTGSNSLLSNGDIKRRLPCNGEIWERSKVLDVTAPYFGIADRQSQLDQSLPMDESDGEDRDLLGGFAFCVEATESLSLVTSFARHQDLKFPESRQAQVWLTDFKQLDMRLRQ